MTNRALPVWAFCLLLACPGPPPPARPDGCLIDATARVSERWPYARQALDDERVYGNAVWFWAHKRGSIDGFGVTLATLTHRPNVLSVVDQPSEVQASGRVDEPSLLFYDQRGEDPTGWPLIGMGWFMEFEPCERPLLQCSLPEDFFIHEAGYHRIPVGDGGMDVVGEDDVRRNVDFDPEGCSHLHAEDLQVKIGRVRHGRTWVTHVWFPPEGSEEEPVWAAEDPWRRWEDATDRATVDGIPFYSQGVCVCDGTEPEREPRGCNR